jgi:hypothetical protein
MYKPFKKPTTLRDVYEDYTQTSTVIGVNRIHTAPYRLQRVLWSYFLVRVNATKYGGFCGVHSLQFFGLRNVGSWRSYTPGRFASKRTWVVHYMHWSGRDRFARWHDDQKILLLQMHAYCSVKRSCF